VHGYSPELIRLLLATFYATETLHHKEKLSASSPYPPLEGDTGGGGNFEIPVPQDAQIICLVIQESSLRIIIYTYAGDK